MAHLNQYTAGIGSNTPDSEEKLQFALTRLAEMSSGQPTVSPRHVSESYTGCGAPYLNCVVSGRTMLSLNQMQEAVKRVEREAGRTPQSKAEGVMPLDIDIVVWQGQVIDSDEFGRSHFATAYAELTENQEDKF